MDAVSAGPLEKAAEEFTGDKNNWAFPVKRQRTGLKRTLTAYRKSEDCWLPYALGTLVSEVRTLCTS